MKRNSVFVVYASKDAKISSIIMGGVGKANAISVLPNEYHPWEFNDISGRPLASPILTKIDESPFVVADITYLNLNVVYEIGYAIGRGKKVLLIKHGGTRGDKNKAKDAGIFDTLGYVSYTDSNSLKSILVSSFDETPLSINHNLNIAAPIYLVEPLTRNQFATTVTSRVKKTGYRFRSFNPSEDVRMSADNAISQVGASSAVVLSLQKGQDQDAVVHNIRTMFVAGLSHGMKKPTLILADASYDVPLDVRDEAQLIKVAGDIKDKIAAFFDKLHGSLKKFDPNAEKKSAPLQSVINLQDVFIGDSTAENEMTTLSNYFLQTNEYKRALNGEVNLVVGRKGSGKTALFIGLRDQIRSDKRNIVVDLKPEGYQLIKLKEDIFKYLNEGARQHLITAFWEYLILLEVTYKVLEKDRVVHERDHQLYELYKELDASYVQDEFASEGDFSERLLHVSEIISAKYTSKFKQEEGQKLTGKEITQLLYEHDIKDLRSKLSMYLKKKKGVWIFFDNLDKGWSTQSVDKIDAIVLRCLIDACRKIERSMKREEHDFHCVIFVRNDVYDHIIANSADYGKEMRATVDWNDANLLKIMMGLRLLNNASESITANNFDKIWLSICDSHVDGEESFSFVVDRSLMRPRNIIKIFNHARSCALNLSHDKILEEDFKKGMESYSQDLLIELDRELRDVFPKAPDLLYNFIGVGNLLSSDELHEIFVAAEIDSSDFEKAADFLLYYGILGVQTERSEYFIFDVSYDLRALKMRASKASRRACYMINPAFSPALEDEPK